MAADLEGEASAPQAGLVDGRVVWIAFEIDGALHLMINSTGAFPAAPPPLAPEGVESFRLRISPVGVITLAYSIAGDVWYVLGNSIFLPDPTRATSTDDLREGAPDVGSDSFANVFVTFERDSDVWIATDAGAPQAAFRAEPPSGEAPLTVEFFDESLGAVTGWRWDFGDGTTSTERHPVHVFERSGEFRVQLTAIGPGGESALRAEEIVLVADPSNRMWMASVRAFPGQSDVFVPVLVTHDSPAQGFQVAGVFDPLALEVTGIDFRASNVGNLTPELAAFNVSHDPAAPYFTAGILFDIQPPFDRRTLPPGDGQRVASVVVNVRDDAVPGTRTPIGLRHGVGMPPLSNIITTSSQTVLAVVGEPAAAIIDELGPARFFVRGDTDGSLEVNLTDPIQLLNFLFLGGPPPECMDAADATDDGEAGLSDAVFTLNYLFRAGPYPLPPYPLPGLDPTDDSLRCEP